MTVSASLSDCCHNRHPAVAAVHLGPEEGDALERGRAAASLADEAGRLVRADQDRIRFIQGLLHLDHVVGTAKPEGVDLKPSWLAVPALPVKRLRG